MTLLTLLRSIFSPTPVEPEAPFGVGAAKAVAVIDVSDVGGGLLNSTTNSFVKVDGNFIAVTGATGALHSPCGGSNPTDPTHCAGAWNVTVASRFFTIDESPVVLEDDNATCVPPHSVANGASFFTVT